MELPKQWIQTNDRHVVAAVFELNFPNQNCDIFLQLLLKGIWKYHFDPAWMCNDYIGIWPWYPLHIATYLWCQAETLYTTTANSVDFKRIKWSNSDCMHTKPRVYETYIFLFSVGKITYRRWTMLNSSWRFMEMYQLDYNGHSRYSVFMCI